MVFAEPSALNCPSNFNWNTEFQVIPVKADLGKATLFQEPGVKGTSTRTSPAPVPLLMGETFTIRLVPAATHIST